MKYEHICFVLNSRTTLKATLSIRWSNGGIEAKYMFIR